MMRLFELIISIFIALLEKKLLGEVRLNFLEQLK